MSSSRAGNPPARRNARTFNPSSAIFGTRRERALDAVERHKLGAHYTPRAYVERLVLPTIIEPLRDDWEAVKAAAVTLVNAWPSCCKCSRRSVRRAKSHRAASWHNQTLGRLMFVAYIAQNWQARYCSLFENS